MKLLNWITILVMVMVMMTMMVQRSNGARILMAVPISTKSHENFLMPLSEHLARKNHTVTFISGFESTKSRPNIEVIHVPESNLFKNVPNLFTANKFSIFTLMFEEVKNACMKALKYEPVQKLNDEKFDLIILHAGLTECFISFAYKLKVPYLFVYPNKALGVQTAITGSPAFPSLSASIFLDLNYPLTFTGRMISTLYDVFSLMLNIWILIPSQDAECRASQSCPQDMPSLYELQHKGSLFITNSVRTLESPTLPFTPTVVHAGGLHCRPAKPLTKDLEQWIVEAGEPGFIYFSLGTVVQSSTMPENYRKILVEVFGSLQQKVLWKWDEDTMEDLPPNVRLSKWLPQQDILGHPKLRLFITHGGLFSTQEATYHGVPVLGLPVSIDQNHNMRMVQQEGWGNLLNWEDLTYDILRSHILHTMDDTRVKENVQWRSNVMRDQPMSPGDWAVYWIEYVLRHKGATHLRSPAMDIPWYQLYNVDVWTLVVVVTIVTISLFSWISYKIIRILIRCCCGSNKKKKD